MSVDNNVTTGGDNKSIHHADKSGFTRTIGAGNANTVFGKGSGDMS